MLLRLSTLTDPIFKTGSTMGLGPLDGEFCQDKPVFHGFLLSRVPARIRLRIQRHGHVFCRQQRSAVPFDTRVQFLPEPVRKEIDPHHQQHQGRSREDDHPPHPGIDVILAYGDHHTEGRFGQRNTDTEEAQGGLEHNDYGKVHRHNNEDRWNCIGKKKETSSTAVAVPSTVKKQVLSSSISSRWGVGDHGYACRACPMLWAYSLYYTPTLYPYHRPQLLARKNLTPLAHRRFRQEKIIDAENAENGHLWMGIISFRRL